MVIKSNCYETFYWLSLESMGICKELLVEWKVGDLDTVKEDMGITSLCLFWYIWIERNSRTFKEEGLLGQI